MHGHLNVKFATIKLIQYELSSLPTTYLPNTIKGFYYCCSY